MSDFRIRTLMYLALMLQLFCACSEPTGSSKEHTIHYRVFSDDAYSLWPANELATISYTYLEITGLGIHSFDTRLPWSSLSVSDIDPLGRKDQILRDGATVTLSVLWEPSENYPTSRTVVLEIWVDGKLGATNTVTSNQLDFSVKKLLP